MNGRISYSKFARRTLQALLTASAFSLLLVAMVSADGNAADNGQCSNKNPTLNNCVWINSVDQSSNSLYFEGMAVPQRALYDSITPVSAGNNTHTITFSTQATNSGAHAYDWLTSYAQASDLSAQLGSGAMTLNPCGDLTGTALTECNSVNGGSSHAVIDVPDDPFISANCNPLTTANCTTQNHISAFEGKFGNRTIDLWANNVITGTPTLTLVHNPSADGSDAGNTNTDIDYTLTYTSSATVVLLQFAAHIACGFDPQEQAVCWGGGLSASNISGAPYHVSYGKSFDGKGGNQDNQLMAAAVQPPPAMSTQVSATTRLLGQSVTDKATLTGSNGTIAGTVNFFACGPTASPAQCSSNGTQVPPNNQAVNGASPQTVTSGPFTPSQPGTYCFRFEFTHTNANYSSGVTFSTTGECVTYSRATAVTLSSLKASLLPSTGRSEISIAWATGSEVNTAGFNLYRSENSQGPYVRINSDLIPASNDAVAGGKYEYVDSGVMTGHTYYYQLEDVELNGTSVRHPAVQATALSAPSSGAAPSAVIGLGAGLLALAAAGMLILRRRTART